MTIFKSFSNLSKKSPCNASLIIFRYVSSQNSNFEPSKKPSYLHYIGKDPLVSRTIGQTLDLTADKYPNREALVSYHEHKRYTFAEVRDKVDRLGAAFLKLGLQQGDRIGLWAPNTAQWYLSGLAAARAGLILVGINPVFQGPEVEYCLNKVGVKALITTESFRNQKYYEILQSVIPDLKNSQPGEIKSQRVPSLKSLIINSEEKLPGSFQFKEMYNIANQDLVDELRKNQSNIEPDSPCNVQFTSGTTGKPKATILTHFGFVNNGIHIGNRNEFSTKPHRICVQVPFFHAYGVTISITAALCHGVTLVLPSAGFDPKESLKAIVQEHCTIIHGTPTMYVDLVHKQQELQLPIKSAEIAITGGAPCSPQLFQDIKHVLGLKKVKTVFGMTENTAVSFQSKVEEPEELVLQTVGHLQDHIEAKVVDSNGKMVPFGQPGELWIRGYFIMLEYFEDENKTKETIGIDRWLRTGDQFILEENGYGRIVGRIKEMINRGGENIFPKEIEDFLNTHPDVIETYVIGIPDERLGESVCAFVRLRSGVDSLDKSQIKEFCKGKISHFKIPKYIKVVKDFPKTTSGKIQKFKLREIFDNNTNL